MATPTHTNKPIRTPRSGAFTPSASSPTSHPHLSSNHIRSPSGARTRAGTLSRMEQSHSQQGGTPLSGTLQGSSPAPAMMGTPSLSQGLGMPGTPPPSSMGSGGGGGGVGSGAGMQRGASNMLGLGIMSNGAGAGGGGFDAASMAGSNVGAVVGADREMFARSRIQEIMQLLSGRWGYVSRVGVQRCAARLKLECLWETGEEEEDGVLDVAGDGILVQITFKGVLVQDVQLQFPEPSESTNGTSRSRDEEEDRRGGEILKMDLQGWEHEREKAEFVSLRRFGENMHYFAEVDQLGKSGVSCFEALDGVYRGLRKVEDWWSKRPEGRHKLDMLCRGSGWPRMHAGGKVGLRLDYWLHQWQVKKKAKPEAYLRSPTYVEPDLFSLHLGVEPRNPASYLTPVRNSTEWFDFLDGMPIDDDDSPLTQFPPIQLSQREPETTVLSATGTADMDIDETGMAQNLPSVQFTARFDPPLAVGWQAVMAVLGNKFVPNNAEYSPYSTLILPNSPISREPDSQPLRLAREVYDVKSDTKKILHLGLSGAQAVPAYVLREVPFSHPMELLQMLPIIRQWAWLEKVLRRGLGSPLLLPTSGSSCNTHGRRMKGKKRRFTAMEVRAILKAKGTWTPPSDTESDEEEEEETIKLRSDIDVQLEVPADMTSTSIYLSIMVYIGNGYNPVYASLSIEPGPRLELREESIGDEMAQRMARVLEATEDIGLLDRWVREQVQKSNGEDEDMT